MQKADIESTEVTKKEPKAKRKPLVSFDDSKRKKGPFWGRKRILNLFRDRKISRIKTLMKKF